MSTVLLDGESCHAATNVTTIRDLNDAFRKTFIGGRVVLTSGMVDLGQERVERLLHKVQTFDEFDSGNDPYNEHDFGMVQDDDDQCFWKIDYYDRTLKAGSENPADPEVTTRVMTIMLPREW